MRRRAVHGCTRAFLVVLVAVAVLPPVPGAAADADGGPAGRALSPGDAMIRDAVQGITQAEIRATIQDLQDFGTRHVLSSKNQASVDYLAVRLAALGYAPVQDRFVYAGDKFNVLATLPGRGPSPRTVYVGAHLDSINHDSLDLEATAPGADDDGSGVAAVLAAARVLRDLQFRDTIVFALWNGEEICCALGSTAHANALSAAGAPVDMYLNIDTVAYNPRHKKVDLVYFDPRSRAFADEMVRVAEDLDLGIVVIPKQDPGDPNVWGDNEAFHRVGYAAVAMTEAMDLTRDDSLYTANPSWHTASDTIDLLNLDLGATAARLAAASLARWAGPLLPDLAVTMDTPGGPLPEGDAFAGIAVVNSGNGSGVAAVELLVDSTLVNRTEVPLGPGAARVLAVPWVATPGTHDLEVRVSSVGLREWSTTDNIARSTVTILAGPDLVVLDAVATPAVVTDGDRVSLAVILANLGGLPARCSVTVWDGDRAVGIAGGDIVSGGSLRVPIEWVPAGAGLHLGRAAAPTCAPGESSTNTPAFREFSFRVNALPAATLSVDPPAVTWPTGAVLTFSLEVADDGEGIASWWDFGDGTPDRTEAGLSAQHAFVDDSRSGTYTVRARPIDDDGAMGPEVALEVTILNRPPVARLVADRKEVDPGATVLLSGEGSTDPDGTILRRRWSFGDGSPAGTEDVAVHRFSAPGNYTVVLLLEDDDGATGRDSLTIRVGDLSPIARIRPVDGPVRAGGTVAFSGADSEIRRGDPAAASYLWDFGDGSPTAPGVITRHAFAGPGRYPVTLQVTDGAGATGVAVLWVTVGEGEVHDGGGRRDAVANPAAAGSLAVVLAAAGVATALLRRPARSRKGDSG